MPGFAAGLESAPNPSASSFDQVRCRQTITQGTIAFCYAAPTEFWLADNLIVLKYLHQLRHFT
jgi:hypothetical protein